MLLEVFKSMLGMSQNIYIYIIFNFKIQVICYFLDDYKCLLVVSCRTSYLEPRKLHEDHVVFGSFLVLHSCGAEKDVIFQIVSRANSEMYLVRSNSVQQTHSMELMKYKYQVEAVF